MNRVPVKKLKEFLEACRKVASYGLVKCSSGNMSWRIGKDLMLVKATRTWMAELGKNQVALCRISDGKILNGVKPSAENRFHLGILRERKDVNVVLHFQSPCATALTCSEPAPKNYFVIPEIPFYIGDIATVSYYPPGSAELADKVNRAMKDHNLAIMKSHGQVTVGKDFRDAIQRAVFFELACEVMLLAGKKARPLPKKVVEELHIKGKLEQEGHI
jgi:ribulose-5-phosphate 4-epimerase/fuculose-1-phosphate aldolase